MPPEEVKAIESACQVKLYIAASENQTAGELEDALGTRTGRTLSKTEDAHKVGFGGGTVTKGSEHRPLLAKQEIRDMDPDKIIIMPERQNPILANRIKYYESPAIMKVHAAQQGRAYPFPEADKDHKPVTMTDMRTAAAGAKVEEAAQVKKAEEQIEVDREPVTGAARRRRQKAQFKKKGKGPMSEAGRAALSRLADDVQSILANSGDGTKVA